jgi:enoyl-[acyl-carrier-protein] reductase (NADH)
MATVEGVAELRKKNQLTWPLAKEMNLREGVQLVVVYDAERDEARVRPIRESYAAALRGVYGRSHEEVARYLRTEREAWGP